MSNFLGHKKATEGLEVRAKAEEYIGDMEKEIRELEGQTTHCNIRGIIDSIEIFRYYRESAVENIGKLGELGFIKEWNEFLIRFNPLVEKYNNAVESIQEHCKCESE